MIKVFIVDDHPLIVDGLRAALEAGINVEYTGSAKNALGLYETLQKKLPDVILMDINLPGKSGIELCKEVKEKFSSIKVIALSTSNQASTIRRMLDNGASGYLLKDSSQTEILLAIQQVMTGKHYISFSVSEVLKNKNTQDELPAVTKREREVLELIANGFTNPEIAKKLFLTAATVDTHRTNMLLKFNAKNTAELVKLAVSQGFI
jgi:DNA-binding NarL/FixJ family response regulator